jgi:transposase-like protein
MKRATDKEELNLITLAQQYSDEDKARALLESLIWPNGPTCPHCKADGSDCKDVYKITPKSGSKTRKGLYKCAACRNPFTVTVGTIFEDSHLPISKWLMAIFILCSSKKSISASQLSRMLKISYKAAWFLNHRLRHAMSPEMPLAKLLTGTVEVDETYIGGKQQGVGSGSKARKTPVVALIERSGEARVKVVSHVSARNLGEALHQCVSKDAVVNTDENPSYKKVVKPWKAHHCVNHSLNEYTRKNRDGSIATTNTAESFFSLLKRGVIGAWHHVSREHLPKYANEFAFRWNYRDVTDGERMRAAVAVTVGKRLTYKAVS